MKKYQSYKPSGIEWIGEIPEHWDCSKYKYNIKILSGFPFKSELFDNEIGFPLLRIRDITSGEIQTYYKGEFDEKYVVKKGDVVIGMDGDFNIREWDNDDILLNQRCCKIDEFKNFTLKYIFYTLPFDLKIINDLTYFTTVKHLSVDDLYNIKCIVPHINEQQQIVQFLDEKTELIDKLISTKELKITLLKEKRTSLINQVVTKGLNPNVKMKYSGVEWIGDVPEHWIVTKFNRYVFFQEGPGLRTFQFTDEGIKVICVTNITEKGIDFSYKKFISNEEYLEKYQHFTVQKGDLLLSSSGNSWGKVSEYLDDEKVMLNTSTIRLNTLDSSKMDKTLIKYILKSEFVRTQLDILMTGSCQPNFGPSHLNQLIIPIPPINEQVEIISNIEKYDSEFQKLVQLEQMKIDLLKEYRQSLISEVVTGKIKVTTDE